MTDNYVPAIEVTRPKKPRRVTPEEFEAFFVQHYQRFTSTARGFAALSIVINRVFWRLLAALFAINTAIWWSTMGTTGRALWCAAVVVLLVMDPRSRRRT